MEKTMADLKQMDNVRNKYLQEKENFMNGLEKDLARYKA